MMEKSIKVRAGPSTKTLDFMERNARKFPKHDYALFVALNGQYNEIMREIQSPLLGKFMVIWRI